MKYYVMTVGADGNAAPDRWITDWPHPQIAASHLTNWWCATGRPQKPSVGDIAIQASAVTGRLLGIFRVVREGGQNVPHPVNPERWGWDVGLEPLVTWDLRYAPTVEDIGYDHVKRIYFEVDAEREQAVMNLIRAYLPALSEELLAGKA
jgi:hypothetical protein